jgi:hypothetical protein
MLGKVHFMKRPTATTGDNYLSKMVVYIPTEIIAGYVAVSGFIKGLPPRQQFTWFCIVAGALLVLTPIYLFAATSRPGRTKSFSHPVTGAVAFAAWVFATGGPFERFQITPDGSSGWYNRTIGSIVLVIVCLALPLLEKALFANRPIAHPKSA